MKRIVPSYKTILAFGLTYNQAANLVDQIKARKDCHLHTYDFWISNHRETETWYVYVIDKTISKAFLANPESFVFEVPG